MKTPVKLISSKLELNSDSRVLDNLEAVNHFNTQRNSVEKLSTIDHKLVKTETNSLQSLKSKKTATISRSKEKNTK